jgi:quercetin dioxygenase-like cupin family protein
MNRLRLMAVAFALLAPLPLGGALNALAAPATQAGPSVSFQGTFPITAEAGEYDLVYLVLDFASGAGIPLHYHGGPALVVGMEGELTLHPHGGNERKLLPGDVVNEQALVQHTMTNLSAAANRILAVILLPKGAELTTVIDTAATLPGPTVAFQGSYPLTVAAGEYDLVNLVLDFAPGAQIPLHYHGGPAVVVGKEGELTLRPEGGMEHAVAPGMVVNEKAGARHVMINTSSANASIFAGVLLPKGAELTTLVTAAPAESAGAGATAGMPRTGYGDPGLPLSWAVVAAMALLVMGAIALKITGKSNGRVQR